MTEFCEEQPGFLLHGFSLQLNSDCSDTHLGSLKRPVYNVFRNVNSRHHVPLSSELAYIAERLAISLVNIGQSNKGQVVFQP